MQARWKQSSETSNGLECCFVDWLKYLLLVNTNNLSAQKMSMVVTSFNIVSCSKSRVFTHSLVWWNELNRLGNTFIPKNVSVSKLKTDEIILVYLWMLSETTFSRSHVAFGISHEGEDGRHVYHVHHHPMSKRQHTLVMRLLFAAMFAIFCERSSVLLCTH